MCFLRFSRRKGVADSDLYYFTQKLEKRLKVVTEDEKKMPVLEALHSALISSDGQMRRVLRTRPLEWRSEEVSMFFSQFGLSL